MGRSPLRILYTCFSKSWGGLEIHSLMEAKSFAERGHDVYVACCRGSRLEQEAKRAGIRTLPLRVKGYLHPVAILQMRRFIRKQNIRIIHCQQSHDLALVTPFLGRSGSVIPVVLSKRVGSSVRKRTPIHRFIYGRVSRVLAISEVIRKNVIETTPMDPSAVTVVHHGIDTREFSAERANGKGVRTELGLRTDEIVIGLVGRISPGKGHEEFLRAAARVRRQHSGTRFVLAGGPSYGEERYAEGIRALCTELALDDTVIFTGFRTDVRDVMASFDIFAFPSHAEAFGAVLIEAMALELPVVSTNCDGVLDIVVDGETGLYVEPRDDRGLAESIIRLIGDPDLRRKLGKAGRERVVRLFNRNGMLEKIERIYYEVLDEKK